LPDGGADYCEAIIAPDAGGKVGVFYTHHSD